MAEKHAAIYLRQSLDRGEGIERQRERCKALITARGWTLAGEFADNETPASKDRGDGTDWAKMLARVGKDFKVIVAVDLDRLLRSTRDLNKLIDLGAEVVTVDGEIDLSTADGEFRATMLAGIARFETRRTSERIKRQKQQKAENGEWHGGSVPYGYSVENKTLVPNESESALLNEAAQRLLRGESMHSIIVDWNWQKLRTRPTKKKPEGFAWRQSTLRAMLRNRSMLGETKAGASGWEPIMDQRTFDRLQALFDDPSRKVVHSPGVKGGKYTMGGGLSVCDKCGSKLITTKKSDGRIALGCLSRLNDRQDEIHVREVRRHPRTGKDYIYTGRVLVDHDLLERWAFDQVDAFLKDSDRFRKRMVEPDPELDAKIDALEAKRSDLNEQRERAGRAFIAGIMSEREAQREVERIDAELAGIKSSLDELLLEPVAAEALAQNVDWETFKNVWTPAERREFLRLFMEKVVVHDIELEDRPHTSRKRGESDESLAARREELRRKALAGRVTPVWKWERQPSTSRMSA